MNHKHELINLIIQKCQYKSYLELGIGAALETIREIKNIEITSVDIHKFTEQYPSFVGTTDDFFQSNLQSKFDAIYIDADHSEESVNRDFANAVKALNKGGIIFMHDVGPLFEKDTALTASGTAYKSFIKIRNTTKYDAFSFQFPDGDVIGIVKVRKNPNLYLLKKDEPVTFALYDAEREGILQKKTLEEVLALV